jgi:hypothetical protein
MSKKNKTRNVDEQLKKLLVEQYWEEFSKWVQQFYIYDNYMHGIETIDKGYLEGRELEDYVNEKWKQFLTKYGY